ncbi:MAG TPA: hypothetical protein VE967_06210 [Gemmatimonadaceae bacterium]|nr:hypothetical protein [Gemmatimonadaceae bacterium]
MANVRRTRDPRASEINRNVEEVTAKLRTRGVSVFESDSTRDIVNLLEAVEEFEHAVEAAGGDLMMDEPPAGTVAQPDHPGFAIPQRRDGESVEEFAGRLADVAERLRAGRAARRESKRER